MFASEDAHYSVYKMAALLGLGERNVCLIQTDKAGHMDSLHLESQVQSTLAMGAVPFMVVATAGTMHCL
jgi:diaminobutyrate-2-oxoglutarate transaminase/L-2,4-diaminobutyrate decarboxylase